MSKRKKLLAKLRNNPKTATAQDIETLLLYFGFTLDRIAGSHHIFIFRDKKREILINVPIHGKKVKSIYVKQALEKIQDLIAEADEQEETDAENDDD
jgi:predicted RNA binding protein YcfA (HicA-like mRNA interferase family)